MIIVMLALTIPFLHWHTTLVYEQEFATHDGRTLTLYFSDNCSAPYTTFCFRISKMCSFVLLTLADSSIGRVDKVSLSQQTLMEMVIGETENREKICGDTNEMKEVKQWKGLKLDGDEIKEIDWQGSLLQGSLHLEWLPPTVNVFLAWENNFTGTIDFAYLPRDMKHLEIDKNRFTGSMNLDNLPEKMEHLGVTINQLAGSLQLGRLPDSLTEFYASENEFSGCVDLTRLPVGLTDFDLSFNQLGGSVDLTRLPIKLKNLYLDNNQFNGILDLTELPMKMSCLILNKNYFSGEVDLSHLPSTIQKVDISDNRLSGEILIPGRLFRKVNVDGTKLIKRILE